MNIFRIDNVSKDIPTSLRWKLISHLPILRKNKKEVDFLFADEWDKYPTPSSTRFIYKISKSYWKLQFLYIIQWICFLCGWLILTDYWDFLQFIPIWIKSYKQLE